MSVEFSSVNNKTFNDFQTAVKPQAAQSVDVQEKTSSDSVNISSSPIAAVKVGDVKEEEHGHKKYYIAGISAGSAALISLIGLGLLSKGTSGGFAARIRAFGTKLKSKAYDLNADYKNLTFVQKVKLKIAKIMAPTMDFLEATSNTNVIKDGGTLQIMKKSKTEWLANWITGGFKKVVLKTKDQSYRAADMSGAKFCNFIEDLAQSAKGKGKDFEQLSQKISDAFASDFSTQKHQKRAQTVWDAMKDLHDRVWKSFSIFKKENNLFAKENRGRLKSYITMDMSANERNIANDYIKIKKTALSNNIEDNKTVLKNALAKIVNESNPSSVDIIRKIETQIESYSKLGGAAEVKERLALAAELNKSVESLKHSLGKDCNNKKITEAIDAFKKVLDPKLTEKGEVQKVLTAVKETFGKESNEYKNAKQLADKFNADLNKAITTEMTSYEKLAELRMGSAPTDILGILCPAALGAWFIVNSKNKDERVTNALTKGIPIIGGIGTALYGTARMYTGPTNMAFGLISGAILSAVGSKVDEAYKAYSKKQSAFKKEFEAMKLAQAFNKQPQKQEVI